MKKFYIILTLLFLAFQPILAFPTRPSPNETSGDLCTTNNPDFVEYRYEEQIPYCVRNVDIVKKKQIYELYKIPTECRHRYTVDHFIPLALGGSNDELNLWPEHKLVKATRPNLELDLYYRIKNSEIKQLDAIDIIKAAKMNPSMLKGIKSSDPCDQNIIYNIHY